MPAGAYLLDVLSVTYNFTTLRVDISAKHNGAVKARSTSDMNTFLPYPLEMSPSSLLYLIQVRRSITRIRDRKSVV